MTKSYMTLRERTKPFVREAHDKSLYIRFAQKVKGQHLSLKLDT